MTETVTKPYRVASGDGLANVWWKSGRVTVKAGSAETDHTFFADRDRRPARQRASPAPAPQ